MVLKKKGNKGNRNDVEPRCNGVRAGSVGDGGILSRVGDSRSRRRHRKVVKVETAGTADGREGMDRGEIFGRGVEI